MVHIGCTVFTVHPICTVHYFWLLVIINILHFDLLNTPTLTVNDDPGLTESSYSEPNYRDGGDWAVIKKLFTYTV